MRVPEDLYVLHADLPPTAPPDPRGGPVLLHGFSGFLDAGSAGALAVSHVLATLPHRELATFDADELIDYRARRPRLTFDGDHYAAVESAELVLHEVHDGAGTRFLLLTGPEPDFQWTRFVAAVRGLVERLGVRLTVGMSAIPWAAPHTRPIEITPHATDPSLVTAGPAWVGRIEVPGHVAGLLELRLGQTGHPAMGFAVHVPHYLAQIDYPRAAVTLLEAVSHATGLVLPTEALRLAADTTEGQIATQFAESSEYSAAVRALEEQYDAVAGARAGLAAAGPVPTADEIGAQVESFLAELDDRSEG